MRLEVAEVVDTASTFWEILNMQQVLKATVDTRHLSRVGWKKRCLP